MNVYITNIAKFDISIREKTLKPGGGERSGGMFPEEVLKQDGVVAFVKKGWLRVEMVKESPDGVSVGVVSEPSTLPTNDNVQTEQPPAARTTGQSVPDNTQTGQPSVSGNNQPHDDAHAGKRKKKE
jgi:hypothetical protein